MEKGRPHLMQGRLEVVEAVSPDLQMQHDHRRLRQSLEIKLDLRQLPKEERENERENERERERERERPGTWN